MKMSKNISFVAALAIATVLVTGCTERQSNPDAPAVSMNVGTVSDGKLSYTPVCIDINKNNVCDANEAASRTNEIGAFNFDSHGQTGPLLAYSDDQSVDLGTGMPFDGMLKAPAGSTVVTPVTSAIEAVSSGQGVSATEAERIIKTSLGITSTVELTSFDPFSETTVKSQDVLAATTHLQTIVHAVSTGVASSKSASTKVDAAIMNEALKNVVKTFKDDGAAADLDASAVAKAVKATATEVYKDDTNARVAAIASADGVAVQAVAVAEDSKAKVKAATPAKATDSFNTGMYTATTDLSKSIETETTVANTAVKNMSAAQITTIDEAQKDNAAKEAEAEAKKAAAEAAEAEAKKAAEEAAKEDATQAQIVAAAQAEEAAHKAAAAKAAADREAALAAEEALKQEQALASAEAAKVKAAQQKAEAEAAKAALAAKAEAEARELAAKEAAEAAAAAADAAKAKADAAAKKAEHDAAIKAAEDAAKAAEAKAKAEAEAAAAEEAKQAAAAKAAAEAARANAEKAIDAASQATTAAHAQEIAAAAQAEAEAAASDKDKAKAQEAADKAKAQIDDAEAAVSAIDTILTGVTDQDTKNRIKESRARAVASLNSIETSAIAAQEAVDSISDDTGATGGN